MQRLSTIWRKWISTLRETYILDYKCALLEGVDAGQLMGQEMDQETKLMVVILLIQ